MPFKKIIINPNLAFKAWTIDYTRIIIVSRSEVPYSISSMVCPSLRATPQPSLHYAGKATSTTALFLIQFAFQGWELHMVKSQIKEQGSARYGLKVWRETRQVGILTQKALLLNVLIESFL